MTHNGARVRTAFVAWAGVLAVGILVLAFGWRSFAQLFPKPEVRELSSVSWTLPQYEEYFTVLAKTKGAQYAFEVLNDAYFPRNIDTHLIGHDIGYVFYDQVGIAGLSQCVHTLGDACIHALVTEEFLNEGQDALQKMAAFCTTYSPDSVTYANCFHGIGHGILAYAHYDLAHAVPECKTMYDIVLAKYPNAAAKDVWGECVGGITMEMFQGRHDPAAWEKMKAEYLPQTDPLAPCDAPFMPEETRTSCYLYLNGRLAGIAGATYDGNFDHSAVFAKMLSYCSAIPDTDGRRACYGGVGVTFLYAVTDSDQRKFSSITDDGIKSIQNWCMLEGDIDGEGACLLTVAEVLLGGGEHGTRPAERFCTLVGDATLKDRCYNDVVETGRRYLPPAEFGMLCAVLPGPYRNRCFVP